MGQVAEQTIHLTATRFYSALEAPALVIRREPELSFFCAGEAFSSTQFRRPMLLLLSPAKRLDYQSEIPAGLPSSQLRFSAQSSRLITALRTLPTSGVAQLMSLSAPLAELNAARYRDWTAHATPANARQAILAFAGDVYGGLDASSLAQADLLWAQDHLAILSGLYGILRPLDLMQPYRLEMGTRLVNEAGQDLYQLWQPLLADEINLQLQTDNHPVVVNLASQEYAKAIDRSVLKATVVDCVFEDWQTDRYRVVGVHAKRARGWMARFAILARAEVPDQLRAFCAGGYSFNTDASTVRRMVFRRRA